MEQKLYDACAKRNITITISHRPVLEQYHNYVLNVLKDGNGGYTWRETSRRKAVGIMRDLRRRFPRRRFLMTAIKHGVA